MDTELGRLEHEISFTVRKPDGTEKEYTEVIQHGFSLDVPELKHILAAARLGAVTQLLREAQTLIQDMGLAQSVNGLTDADQEELARCRPEVQRECERLLMERHERHLAAQQSMDPGPADTAEATGYA